MKTFTSKSVEKLLQSLSNDPRLQALDKRISYPISRRRGRRRARGAERFRTRPEAMEPGKARGKRDLDDGAVEELLFGWFEGWNREGRKTKISSMNSILSFPFFLF